MDVRENRAGRLGSSRTAAACPIGGFGECSKAKIPNDRPKVKSFLFRERYRRPNPHPTTDLAVEAGCPIDTCREKRMPRAWKSASFGVGNLAIDGMVLRYCPVFLDHGSEECGTAVEQNRPAPCRRGGSVRWSRPREPRVAPAGFTLFDPDRSVGGRVRTPGAPRRGAGERPSVGPGGDRRVRRGSSSGPGGSRAWSGRNPPPDGGSSRRRGVGWRWVRCGGRCFGLPRRTTGPSRWRRAWGGRRRRRWRRRRAWRGRPACCRPSRP